MFRDPSIDEASFGSHYDACLLLLENAAFTNSSRLTAHNLTPPMYSPPHDAAVVFLGLLALFASAAAYPHPDWPQILGVEVDDESLGHHHVDKYRIKEGHVVRRMLWRGSNLSRLVQATCATGFF